VNNIKTKDSLILKVIAYLEDALKDSIISVYGIGSYFDKTLPSDWKIADIDVIVILNSLDKLPKLEWTDVRYETKTIENCNVWLGYNTLNGLKEKETFENESFANYEWSLLDLKYQNNSQLLYGQDIRSKLPRISDLRYDFDDIFIRSLYHLDKSLKESKTTEKSLVSKKEFTKAVFKFGFYVCKYFDKNYCLTSVLSISKHIDHLQIDNIIKKNLVHFLQESINFRRTDKFTSDFKTLRKNFIFYIFSLLKNGKIHRKLEFQEFVNYLNNYFNGLPYLTKYIKTAKKIYNWSKIT
jgi:hypothetical protein